MKTTVKTYNAKSNFCEDMKSESCHGFFRHDLMEKKNKFV